jgi:hypothetical protein
MLKIKDNVDLKELAKEYGFIYCQDWSIPYEDDNYGYLMFNDNFSIVWRDDSKYYTKGRINFTSSPSIEELNLLYDLIKADLVEKVKE